MYQWARLHPERRNVSSRADVISMDYPILPFPIVCDNFSQHLLPRGNYMWELRSGSAKELQGHSSLQGVISSILYCFISNHQKL